MLGRVAPRLHPEPGRERLPHRAAVLPRLRDLLRLRGPRRRRRHDPAMGEARRRRRAGPSARCGASPQGSSAGGSTSITSSNVVPGAWWGPFAIWHGGLGIWGGIAAGTLAGSGSCTAAGRTSRCSWTASPPGCSSRRRSAASATGSTRSCSAARPHCRGASRSTRRTVPPATERRDVPPDVPLRDHLEPRPGRLPRLARPPPPDPPAGPVRPLCRRLLAVGSARSCCASTPPITSSACG